MFVNGTIPTSGIISAWYDIFFSIPDEGYSRNAPCALNWISTFLHFIIIIEFKMLLSLNNTVCDNYTNKHVTNRT